MFGLHDWKCVTFVETPIGRKATTVIREGRKVRLYECRRCPKTKEEVVGCRCGAKLMEV